ncbi:MAG: hypothetical protein J6A85_03695 [Clostridia bacterium]|nr:hypothetical protein [Clostridia bacterium]
MTKTKRIVLWSVLGVVATAIVVVITYFICLLIAFSNSRDYRPDIVIENPNGEGTLIIEEWLWGFGAGAEIYYKEDGFLKQKKKIGGTSADETCTPFSDGRYTVTWGEDTVTLEYDNGLAKEWVSKTFELP